MVYQLPDAIAAPIDPYKRLFGTEIAQYILHIYANPAFALLQVIEQANHPVNFSHAISIVNSNLHPVGITNKHREFKKV
jgi:hypothetical protein